MTFSKVGVEVLSYSWYPITDVDNLRIDSSFWEVQSY